MSPQRPVDGGAVEGVGEGGSRPVAIWTLSSTMRRAISPQSQQRTNAAAAAPRASLSAGSNAARVAIPWIVAVAKAMRASRTAYSCATAISRFVGDQHPSHRQTAAAGESFPHRDYRLRRTIY